MQKVERAFARIRPHLTPLAIGGVFVFLAGRVASVRQFSPFDGPFHFGLIKLYSHHLNPFLGSQPAGADAYGAVARDPSYLYHYLMSFPYRLVSLFTNSGRAHVLTIRWLDIGLGLLTLYLVYCLARRFGLPKWGAQLVAFSLAITPVFYDLAGQINYDNLLIPLTIGSFLLTLKVADRFRAGFVPAQRLLGLTALVLLACLVKYSYLPIALGITLYLIITAIHYLGLRNFFLRLFEAFRFTSRVRQVVLVLLVSLSFIMWFQRYGVNIITYHTPHPQCNATLSVAQCSAYGPWARNYQLHETKNTRPENGLQVVSFTKYWLRSSYIQVYALVHPSTGAVVYTQEVAMRTIAKAIFVGGVISALLAVRLLIRQRKIWAPALLIGGLYVVSLWGQNFSDFHNLHALVAIQGRYLLPFLPFLYLGVAIGYASLFELLMGLERGRIRAMVSALFVIGWLGLRSVKRLGHAMLVGVVQSVAATSQAFNAVIRQPTG